MLAIEKVFQSISAMTSTLAAPGIDFEGFYRVVCRNVQMNILDVSPVTIGNLEIVNRAHFDSFRLESELIS